MTIKKVPQHGKFAVSLACIGEYKLVDIGLYVSASIYDYKIITFSDDRDDLLFHDMIGNGIGMGPIGGPEEDDVIHYATYVDSEGDKIFERFKGIYTGPASGNGIFVFLGGTGKYQDIQGKGEQWFKGLNYNYHDPENPNPSGPVQVKAKKTGEYRLS